MARCVRLALAVDSILVGSILMGGCGPAPTSSYSLSSRDAQPAPLSDKTPAAPPADEKSAPSGYVLLTGSVYYKGDPRHGHGAGGTLRKGTKVAVLRRVSGFSLVRSEDGQQGYVPANVLELADNSP